MDYCSEHRDWAAVEYNFLDVVLNKLVSVYDYLQFSLVCKSWYYVALRNKCQRSIITSNVPQLPMLIVPSKDGIEKKHCLYDLRNNEVRDVDFKIRYNKRYCGSSHGWLFVLEETMNITLFNPFSGSVISLPQITRDPFKDIDDESEYDEESPFDYRSHILKAIVTKDPLLYPNDYMIAVIYGLQSKLCIIKANDKAWTYLNPSGIDINCFGDVTVHNDVVYVLNDNLILWKVEEVNDRDTNSTFYNLKRLTPKLDLDDSSELYFDASGQVYLVESTEGELLLVKRSLDFQSPDSTTTYLETLNFFVFKLTPPCEDGMQRHIEVESLDNDAMFIGDNHSVCVSTKDFPKCLPNRIYYTDNNCFFGFLLLDGCKKPGIFNLEDRSFNTHYIMDRAHKDLPPPIWIVPTIRFKESEGGKFISSLVLFLW